MYKLFFSLVLFFGLFNPVFATNYCVTNVNPGGSARMIDSVGGAVGVEGLYSQLYITSNCPASSMSLGDLTDVTISSAISGQVLMKGSGDWVNFSTSTGAGGTTVNNFSSTTLLSVATGTALNISSEPVNMANGMLLFMVSFWGTIWFFRKNR